MAEMPESASALADYMSSISEDSHCASWLSDLEFYLWDSVVGAEQRGVYVKDYQVSALLALSNACGGWVRWDAGNGRAFVALDDWRKMYEEKRNAQH